VRMKIEFAVLLVISLAGLASGIAMLIRAGS
jgi:hypothetical protein